MLPSIFKTSCNMKLLLLLLSALCIIRSVCAQQIIETPKYRVEITSDGKIASYVDTSRAKADSILFRKDKYAGFAFEGITLRQTDALHPVFEGVKDSIVYRIAYRDEAGVLLAETSLKNTSRRVFLPQRGVKVYLRLDTYMDKFPRWNHIFFPTMLRCERTHMTSYFATPEGKILSVVSPDPVASWSNEYQYANYEMNIQGYILKEGLHRIYTSAYYLMHCLPLPPRHPQHLYSLAPGEEITTRFYLRPADDPRELGGIARRLCKAPVISADLYTLPVGDKFEGELIADDIAQVRISTPRHESDTLRLTKTAPDRYRWEYLPFSGVGEYTVNVMERSGKSAEMKLYVRPDFNFYLSHARREGLRNRPTTHHGAECFYPLYTYFLSRRYIPDEKEDLRAEVIYDSIIPALFDPERGEMRRGKYRLQDAATMAGVLTDRYCVTRDIEDMNHASALADYLISCQKADGGFYNPMSKVHYTSVIYIAKSIMEVMVEEKKLAAASSRWKEIYDRHKAAIINTLEDLARRGDDVQTEGQMTFEDGMISCSATQLALGALKIGDSDKRKRYTEQAVKLNRKHWCLTQSLIPDCRMNGATLRFWEYQYTINFMSSAMNSPCGWSAWKLYGSWYLYLLTGQYRYMREVINGLGSNMQLLDAKSGELRFSFVTDPYIEAYQFTETPIGSRKPALNKIIIGEDYMSQISNWHYADYWSWRKNLFGIDNFVHEVFKCMCELFIDNAYIIEHDNGRLQAINCSLTRNDDGVTEVKFATPHVTNLHINLRHEHTLRVNGRTHRTQGLKWLTGTPEILQPF